MTAEAEIHDNFETTRLNKEPDYFNLYVTFGNVYH